MTLVIVGISYLQDKEAKRRMWLTRTWGPLSVFAQNSKEEYSSVIAGPLKMVCGLTGVWSSEERT